MGMPGALGAGVWGVQTTHGCCLPPGASETQSLNLGLWALFLSLGFWGGGSWGG